MTRHSLCRKDTKVQLDVANAVLGSLQHEFFSKSLVAISYLRELAVDSVVPPLLATAQKDTQKLTEANFYLSMKSQQLRSQLPVLTVYFRSYSPPSKATTN